MTAAAAAAIAYQQPWLLINVFLFILDVDDEILKLTSFQFFLLLLLNDVFRFFSRDLPQFMCPDDDDDDGVIVILQLSTVYMSYNCQFVGCCLLIE
ncbi:hypothetical protein DERF_015887 [Dermatophagoides farinae]|uniref:Uncharacterized protein n=1 Tax=Dermatophagoides farinae TaxID=6954 RepID=A0A922L0R3_DERFA|nr:hypothetical protein DERF_015887 [Dermatophagoides farinae]